MSAAKKFSVISGIMIVCLIGLCLSFYMLLKANKSEVESYSNQYKTYLLADEMRQSSDDLTRLVRTFTVTQNESYVQQYMDILDIRNGKKPRPQAYNRIYWDFVAGGKEQPRPDTTSISLLDLMKETGFTRAELDRLAEAGKRSDDLVKNETRAMELVRQAAQANYYQKEKLLAEARELTHNKEYHKEKAYIMEAIDEFYVMLEKRVQNQIKQADDTRNFWKTIVIAALGVLVVVLAVFTVFFFRILKQLGEDPGYLYDVSNEIAGGNLDVSFRGEETKSGVYGVFREMVATMKGKIREAEKKSQEAANESKRALEAMEQARAAKKQAEQAKAEGMRAAAQNLEAIAGRVSTASEQLSAQTIQTNKGAEQQKTMAADAATAMEEMNSTVLEVARNASSAAENAEKAKFEANAGKSVIEELLAAIREVHQKSQGMKEQLSGLGGRAESIGQIMNVITDIADQTNLLALNAAIEAARAGEAGRGFAVVADEVRKLAEKTMEATKDVAQAINDIQHDAKQSIEGMDAAGEAIEHSNSLADNAGKSLFSILNMVEGTADQARNIATAAEEQSAASEEINTAVQNIHTISSETAESMEQANNAIGELATMCSELKALVEKLKTA